MKVSIIGVGNVGENVAYLLTALCDYDVYLFGRYKDGFEPAKAKALDLKQMATLLNKDVQVVGVSYDVEGFEKLEGSDIVVITAGISRGPGMSREDLLIHNVKILSNFCKQIIRYSPNSVVIVVSNPVDVLTYATLKLTKFPSSRVIGMAGVLDSARFKSYVKDIVNLSYSDIRALVIGTHGDLMVPVMSRSYVGNMPMEDVLSTSYIDTTIENTREGGKRVIELMSKSAYYGPAASVVVMVDAILKDKRKIYPCSVYMDGEIANYYELQDVCIGVPVILGKGGVVDFERVRLSGYERRELKKSAQSIKELVEWLNNYIHF